MQRRHSVLMHAAEPLVRLEIETDQRTFQWWEQARAVEPEEMAFAVPVRTSPLPGDRVRVVLAVNPNEFSIPDEIAINYLASFIPMLLDTYAGLILNDDEDEEGIDHGPTQPPDDGIPF